MKTLWTLTKIEIKLAVREFSGVLFGLMLPVGLMILLGVLNGNKPAFEGANYTLTQQSFPAVITIGIIATGLMAIPITISSYREKKVLKRFKVTPTSPLAILIAQVVNSFIFSTVSSLLVWVAAKIFFDYKMIGNVWVFLGFYLLVLFSIYSLGLMIASVSKNTKTSNLLTSLVYFPMFFLSGATVPFEIMPKGMQMVSNIMPLTHGIKLLKTASLAIPVDNVLISIIYLSILAITCTIVSVATFKWD